MYRITDENGNVISQSDDIRYVKFKESSGAWIRCKAYDAQCVAINGVRYSLAGREPVEDAPTVVYVREVDSAKEIQAQSQNIGDLGWAIQQMAVEIVEMLETKEDVDNV